jgi:hypothetical protein
VRCCNGMPARTEGFHQEINAGFRHHFPSARKKVDRDKPVFRPSVDREVTFSQNDDAAYTVRAEPVEAFGHDGGARPLCSFEHENPHTFDVAGAFAIAIVEIDECVMSKWGHIR